ncbi:MAG TPA: DUF1579 family protein [Candidatus Acidoferrum sp.]|nr:DUF1579 family protein [Candidatus Acidoferrum sp.]
MVHLLVQPTWFPRDLFLGRSNEQTFSFRSFGLPCFICHCYPSAGTASRPEAAKLAYFARKWVSEAEVKPSAFGPGGKFTSTESCEWLPGKFAILCTSEGNMMGGEYHGLSGMSYDTAEKSYIYYETNNWGENVYSHGSVDGDTWTNQSEMNGKTVRGRFILKRASEDSATFSFEMGMGSDPLANVMQGKQTRQK